MLGIGLWEFLAVAVVVAMLVRPDDIPRMMRKLGRLYGRASSMFSGVFKEIDTGRREAEAEHRRESESRREDE